MKETLGGSQSEGALLSVRRGDEEDDDEDGDGGGGQPAILPVSLFLLVSTVSTPLVAPPPTLPGHRHWWAGEAGNRKS